MQKEENFTVGRWCGQWFSDNRGKWNGNTEGGYRNLIYRHILPAIGNIELTGLTEQMVTDFYDTRAGAQRQKRLVRPPASAKVPG